MIVIFYNHLNSINGIFHYFLEKMTQNNYFLKKFKNNVTNKKFHHNQNQFHFLDECKNSLMSKYKIKGQNKPGINEIFN